MTADFTRESGYGHPVRCRVCRTTVSPEAQYDHACEHRRSGTMRPKSLLMRLLGR